MPWKRNAEGKSVWVDYPWISNPKYAELMKAQGKGPKTWYRHNTWEIQLEQLGQRTFVVGIATKPVELPSYLHADERKRVATAESILGRQSRRATKIFRETVGLLADPLNEGRSTFDTFKGTWVTANDLRLRARELEILGIISANPGIKFRELALIYNTTKRNILRILMVANTAGVQFTGLSGARVKIANYGIYDKEKVLALYRNSDGLEAIVKTVKCIFHDVADERSGIQKTRAVRYELSKMWAAKLEAEKNNNKEA